MNTIFIPFAATQSFSKLAVDYVANVSTLKPFIQDFPSHISLENQIQLRKRNPVNREILHQVLSDQYQKVNITKEVASNIELLLNDKTFTICTAHQPCIFGGPLYFIYKIAHAIRLAKDCKEYFPEYNFVPIFFMGTEDNDIAEIGSVNVDGQKYQWQTQQTGACGRMNTTDLEPICIELLAMLNENLEDEKYLMELFKEAYLSQHSLADATRILVNGLFASHGLVVLDADDRRLKRQFKFVVQDELFQRTSNQLVEKATSDLAKHYKIQARGREINLFYIAEGIRERIEFIDQGFRVHNTDISFTVEEMHHEIETHPEHFSPNVILRPVYQELILPNISFIGGGGELAYWLELKTVFDHFNVTYPILILRNSFLLIEQKIGLLQKNLGLPWEDIFLDKELILKKLLADHDSLATLRPLLETIQQTLSEIEQLGRQLSDNLEKSMKAHHAKSNRISKRIQEKFTAEIKRKEQEMISRVERLKGSLFPNHSLQERYDHFIPYYKIFGKAIIDLLVNSQKGIDSAFIILTEEK
nr:bacillithiol biosynthesis cysteine-adding enzyme BshC [Chitinophagaceae bacterium]